MNTKESKLRLPWRGARPNRPSSGADRAADRQLPDGAFRTLHRLAQWIAATVVRLPYRVRIHGRERIPRTGPVVLVANHSAFVDGPLLFGMLPRSAVFLIKYEMFRGMLGWFLRRIGQIPVRRGEAERTPLLSAVRVLRGGGLVGVFPEGTRGAGDVASVQHGAAWLARTAGAQVLPVACRGTQRPPGQGGRLLPRVDVLFGEPFKVPPGKGRAGLADATERVRTELVDLISELDRLIDQTRRPTWERKQQP